MKTIMRGYCLLFNEITDVSEELMKLEEKLKLAQRQAEELYIEETDEDIINSEPDSEPS
jgi:hypothetical protein